MRASIEVADIFRAAGPAYRAARAGHLSLDQLKVMSAIETCRTAVMGGHVEACTDCGHWRVAYNSCRNRHCPRCQGAAARTWLAEREADLLPVGYFHVVFTLPAEIADVALQNKAAVYGLLFQAASETMATIAVDSKHLVARIGITAVLHTWGSAMTHHPHIHMIVPGGGLSLDGGRWISSRPAFLLPVRVLSKLFRRLFLTSKQPPPSDPVAPCSSFCASKHFFNIHQFDGIYTAALARCAAGLDRKGNGMKRSPSPEGSFPCIPVQADRNGHLTSLGGGADNVGAAPNCRRHS